MTTATEIAATERVLAEDIVAGDVFDWAGRWVTVTRVEVAEPRRGRPPARVNLHLYVTCEEFPRVSRLSYYADEVVTRTVTPPA